MKKISISVFAMLILLPVVIHSGNMLKDQKRKIKGDIAERRKDDKEYREKVVKEVKDHMQFINKQLQFGSNSQIDTPIDYDKIEDAKKNEQPHSNKKIPQKEFGYITGDYIIMRAEPARKGRDIGKIHFQSRVELLMKSEEKEIIDGIEERWILIRRDNGEEGWIFGVYVQKDKPAKQAKPDEKKNQSPPSDSFIVPTEGIRSSNFGYRVHPVTKKSYSFHSGIDIAAPMGTPVKAAENGTVKISDFNNNGYGNLIVIQHESDLSTYYGHLNRRGKNSGQSVKKGDVIGEVGSTGASTGPHLHFEVRRGGAALNPDQFVR